jgi:hypothetical protein
LGTLKKIVKASFILAFLVVFQSAKSQTDSTVTLDQLNQQLENPLSRFWSLIFQENFKINEGNVIEGSRFSNTFNFQPSLPVPAGKNKMLLVRPVFPIHTAPKVSEGKPTEEYTTGLGDIQVFSLYGPDKKGGLIWGAGLTFSFPTASADHLGPGKTQLGPAVMLLAILPNWTLGGIVQQWNSVAGDANRPETSQMDIQYIIRRQIRGKGMSIGMGPNINIDWMAPEGEKLTLPIGLGITKTVKWGKTPWKLRLEPQYSLIKPETYGTQWTIRIQIAPIINSPFI